MNNEELSNIIENLAVEVVMIEHTDHDELLDISDMFCSIKKWAQQNSQPVLEIAAAKSINVLKEIQSESTPDPAFSFSIINKTISEIQYHLKNDFDFSSACFPEELNLFAIQSADNPPQKISKNDTTLDSTELSPDENETGLHHPDKLPSYMGYDLFAEFLSLQETVLDKTEALILSIEKQENKTNLTELKRHLHTTKGEAGFLNLVEVEQLCHIFEDLLGNPNPSRYTDIFFETIDWLRKSFLWYQRKGDQPEPSANIIERMNKALAGKKCNQPDTLNDLQPLADKIKAAISETPFTIAGNPQTIIRFVTDTRSQIAGCFILLSEIDNALKVLRRPATGNKAITDKLIDIQYFATEVKGGAKALDLFEIEYLISEIHNVLNIIIKANNLNPDDTLPLLKEAFLELDLLLKMHISPEDKNAQTVITENLPMVLAKLQSIHMDSAVDETISTEKEPEQAQEAFVTKDMAPELQPKDESNNAAMASGGIAKIKETISVDAERLDKIIDMIGELIVAESMVVQSDEIKKIDSQNLSRHLSQMNKITRGLQETGLSLRMLPIKATFQKMARVARDTAKKCGKNVNFIMSGEETELDKSVIDKIGDPLLHMIRNAVDHGIEKESRDRIKRNKQETATVAIRAFHKGGNIHIEVEDDGEGLNSQKIKAKAVKQNLIDEDAVLTENEILNLIFEPGFSTAQNITDLSGRGVGLNVVKSNIADLHGKIEIKTEAGKGTVFIIKIPLTLAIIDGMVVTSNNERYIIPTLSIITSNRISKDACTFVFGKGDLVNIQGSLVPLFSLSKLFNKNCKSGIPDTAIVVVVEENAKRAAILVDDLLGKQQIVIKSLGESMNKIPGISGGAIMPDGRVGLIIDIASLVFSANN